MAVEPVWENLPKSQTDPQTIEEAIAEGISTHNADTEAHMQENESLEQHRANDIIDHPAESIPNDKNTILPRRFVAIVDPTDSEEFDTINEAVAAAVAAGGGQIRIVGGTYEILEDLTIPAGVYLVGEPDLSTVISCDTDIRITFERNGNPSSILYGAENITFMTTNNGLFAFDDGTGSDPNVLKFRDCAFTIAGLCMPDANMAIEFDGCYFEMQNNYFLRTNARFKFNECFAEPASGATSCVLVTTTASGTQIDDCTINDCTFNGVASASNNFFQNIDFNGALITTNRFNDVRLFTCGFEDSTISQNVFNLWSGTYLQINGGGCSVFGNQFSGGSGNRLRFTSGAPTGTAIGNIVGTPITDDGDETQLMANVGDYSTDTVAFSWYNGGGQAINASTFTKITASEETFDRGNNVSSSTFTAPVDGLYLFTGHVQLVSSNMRAFASIYKNGTEFQRGADIDSPSLKGCDVSALLELSAGDEVELYCWNDAGADTAATGDGGITTFSGILMTRTSF